MLFVAVQDAQHRRLTLNAAHYAVTAVVWNVVIDAHAALATVDSGCKSHVIGSDYAAQSESTVLH